MSMDDELHRMIEAAVEKAKEIGTSIVVITEYEDDEGGHLSFMGTECLLRQLAGDITGQDLSKDESEGVES